MRPRLTLGTRIFAMAAVLVVLAVGTAVVVTYLSGDRIAADAARQTLTRAGSVQSALQEQRLRELTLNARLLAADSALVGYFFEAVDRGDTLSILDQLEQRQDDLGFDFAMVLDEEGRLLVRTDEPDAEPRDLSGRPLVAEALREYEAAGFWKAEDRLYQAVAVPLAVDRILSGYLVTGFALDELTALQVSRISDADVAYLVEDEEGPRIVVSTLDPTLSRELTTSLEGPSRESFQRVIDEGRAVEQMELELHGRPWLTLLRPLSDAAGDPVGVTVSLVSLEPLLAPFRRLETVLLLVGLAAVLLAGGASYLLSRRVMKPVRELTHAAESAREGDYGQRIEIDRADEVGRLARSFDHLLSELREKHDMETYIGDLSRTLGEEEGPEGIQPARTRRLALLAVELRHYGGREVTADPADTVDRLARDLRRLGHVVEAHGGEIRGVFGGRVLAVFEGADRGHRALSTAGEIVRTLGEKESAFDEREPPSVALIDGETVEGTIHWSEGAQTVLLGTPLPRLDVLLREATPGDVALASSFYESMEETFEASGPGLTPQRGFLGTGTLYVADAERIGEVGGRTATTVMDELETLVSPTEADEPPRLATLADVAPGSVLGERFEILGVLGAGGMGVVYKARDRELDELVALKMIRRERATDPDHLRRLKSELKLARRITHPNVLRTYDFGEIGDIPFISMEYVRGITLRTLLRETGSVPFSAGLRLSRQLCRGLGAAHDVGVLHRDIKPENLIVEPAGNAKLMDFGIARPVRRSEGEGATEAGMIVGTPNYLAPEQLRGEEEIDERADLFAVGVVLYEIFTARLPFGGDTPADVMTAILREEPVSPRHWRSELPERLERIILRCLAKERGDRFGSAEEVLEELESLRA